MIIQKRIAQINYVWTPLFYSRGGEVADQVKSKLPRIQVTRDAWRLRNDDQRWMALFTADRAWISWEASPDEPGFITHALQLFSAISESFEIQVYRRIGYRSIILQESETFNTARDSLMSVMFGSIRDWEPLQWVPDDLAVVLEQHGNRSTRLRLGPIRKEEFSGQHSALLEFPGHVTVDAGYLLDIDMWLLEQQGIREPLRELVRDVEVLAQRITTQWFGGEE